MTIRSYLENFAAKTPLTVALKYFQDKVWHERTYAELLSGVREVAEALAANGWGIPCDGAFAGQTRGRFMDVGFPDPFCGCVLYGYA